MQLLDGHAGTDVIAGDAEVAAADAAGRDWPEPRPRALTAEWPKETPGQTRAGRLLNGRNFLPLAAGSSPGLYPVPAL